MAPARRTGSEGGANSKLSLKGTRTAGKKIRKGKKVKSAVKSDGAKQKNEPTPLQFFRYQFHKDFEKNPHLRKDQASMDAVRQTAICRWELMSDAEKAPYVAGHLALWKKHQKTSKRASNLADILGNLKI